MAMSGGDLWADFPALIGSKRSLDIAQVKVLAILRLGPFQRLLSKEVATPCRRPQTGGVLFNCPDIEEGGHSTPISPNLAIGGPSWPRRRLQTTF